MLIRQVLVSLALRSVKRGDMLTWLQPCQGLMPSEVHTTTGGYLILPYDWSS